nr:immunoglobulin heavy chain junction region [Mus musculus]NSM04616.1 immunoglobulin heavy chain junction region [Mus musculus]NSM04658.1 immunoglobulin heavy chain junction region [Mus musculus]NSM05103.1 immunoglobulin heavy chain junction region [Mus musculus]NSM05214.1 immunoglobulin heavy chain junction region [Mus musculus]
CARWDFYGSRTFDYW